MDGQFYELDEPPSLDKKFRHDIDVVVDRIVVRASIEIARLADSLRTALDLADVLPCWRKRKKDGERLTFSEKICLPGQRLHHFRDRAAPVFLQRRRLGPAPSATGWGWSCFFDERLVVPDHALKLYDGAIAPWRKGKSPYFLQTIQSLAAHYEFDAKAPWKDLPAHVKQVLLYGSNGEELPFRYDEGGRVYNVTRAFEGVIPNMERRYRETDSAWVREDFEQYQNNRACGACGGHRLRPEALAVKIGGLHIGQVTEMSIRDALDWVQTVPDALTKQKNEIARAILKEIRERLGFLVNVGLDYLTLGRHAGTLSGGESQRIRLASQIGSGLTGVLYVLDEPSIGLHQRDNDRLLVTLRNLRDQGNTVIVVEHDEEAIRTADFVLDIGPGAGVHGGQMLRARARPAQDHGLTRGKALNGQYI